MQLLSCAWGFLPLRGLVDVGRGPISGIPATNEAAVLSSSFHCSFTVRLRPENRNVLHSIRKPLHKVALPVHHTHSHSALLR